MPLHKREKLGVEKLSAEEQKKLKSLSKIETAYCDAISAEWKSYDSLPHVLEWAAVKNK